MLNISDVKNELKKIGFENHFSDSGLEELLYYFDECNTDLDGDTADYEFDAMCIVESWIEFGKGCSHSFKDFEYRNSEFYSIFDFCRQKGITVEEYESDEKWQSEYILEVTYRLLDTPVNILYPDNGNIIISTWMEV